MPTGGASNGETGAKGAGSRREKKGAKGAGNRREKKDRPHSTSRVYMREMGRAVFLEAVELKGGYGVGTANPFSTPRLQKTTRRFNA